MKKKQIILGVTIVSLAAAVAMGALFLQRQNGGGPGAPGADASKTPWHRTESEALADANTRKAPIFIDFYADWCEPCVQMDRQVFSTDDFRNKAKNWVLLRIDATNESPDIAKLLQKYEVAGLPSLRFRRPDGSPMAQFDVDGGLEFTQLSALMDEAHEEATR